MAQAGFRSYLGFWLGGLSSGGAVSQPEVEQFYSGGWDWPARRKQLEAEAQELQEEIIEAIKELPEEQPKTNKKAKSIPHKRYFEDYQAALSFYRSIYDVIEKHYQQEIDDKLRRQAEIEAQIRRMAISRSYALLLLLN